ncbi:MAG: response regulator [Chitinophagaceae bacterium]|nr:response regulator [Chitinophagaceae bacterium]
MGQYTGLENKKILIVEDVELNQFLARHIMESWGCVVQIAENGALAVDKINSNDFDLVLMDIQMPIMDGLEATRQIRKLQDDRKSSIPIVALTANAMRNNFDMFINAGMNDCLGKPFEEPALFRTVCKNLRENKNSSMTVSAVPEPAPKIVSAAKLYDLSMVEAISAGDRSFIGKMLKLFLDTVPASLKEMRTHTDKREWQELSKVAHKLKSTVDSMGIAEIQPLIRQVESSSKTGSNVEGIPALVKNIMEVMDRVMAQVKKDYSL